jgi:PAS domain S-box-containing protein
MVILSEEKKIHEEMNTLLKAYPFLKQILQGIKQVVWMIDLNTDRVLYVNPAFETNWGQPCEKLYVDPFLLINSVHPEDRVKVLSANLSETRKPLDQTYRIIRPDGSTRWISAHTFLINEESQQTSYQICVAQDVSDQHQIDQTLHKALDRSREQSTLSRRMSLARKPEIVLKTLMSTSELRTAKRAFVLFFESPSDALSHTVELIASWPSHPNSGDQNSNAGFIESQFYEANLFDDIAQSELLHPSKPVLISEITRDKRLSPVVRDLLLDEKIQTIATFPMIASGIWLGCLLLLFPQEKLFAPIELRHIKILVDQAAITLFNLQLLENEASLRHEAEQANEIKTEFLAMISHELRTPLTSIIGFTTTLLAQDVQWEQDEQQDFILTIQQEADRLQELINHLLDLSRLEAGMLPIVRKPYAVRDILQDAAPQLNILTKEHELTMQVPPRLPLIMADAKRIAQVLVNLVRNASMYAPKGTIINISASKRGDFVQINVSDLGPGIPLSDHKKVFKAFLRGQNEENGISKGAGLGLAICKGLVEAHNGRIWIKKKHSPGTTISFTIPLVSTQVLLDDEEGIL